MNTNKVTLIGYTGGNPVCVKTVKGSKKATIRVATHFSIPQENGTRKWESVWHVVVAWDRQAEYAENNFVKGSRILVEGYLSYRQYADHSGHTRYYTSIIAHSLLNLDR
ncbi:MAG: single-stranded DNA-binding protein [Ginsengibacter sp.]